MENNNYKSSTDDSYLQEVRRKNALSRQTDPTYQEMYSMFGMGEKKNNSPSSDTNTLNNISNNNNEYLQQVKQENAQSRANSANLE